MVSLWVFSCLNYAKIAVLFFLMKDLYLGHYLLYGIYHLRTNFYILVEMLQERGLTSQI